MFDAALEALQLILNPGTFMFLVLGVSVGMMVGVLPGMGGIVGMSVLLPFIYGMDQYQGIAMLVGMMAVTQTSDTFVSVLLGVPGSASSQATIMDGYPLAQQGEGARALGAAFFVSMIGGLIGAVALLVFIPVAKPMILALGSPELLMFSLLGVSLVGVLSRQDPIAGLAAAILGLLIATIGFAPAGQLRFVFGTRYLEQGVSIMLIGLGLFAVPEFIELLTRRTSISKDATLKKGGLRKGIRESLSHKRLIVASALGGVGVGIIPGVGGSVVDWLLYGLASQFCRNTENFGKGDIRGVIAPESANNAKEGGTMIPTLLFGIPGSGTSAILLGGLLLLGVTPGPRMLEPANLPFLLVVVWSLAFANVLATGAALGLTRWMVKISTLRPEILVPGLFVLITVAAYQATNRWGDVVLMLLLGIVGYIMKRQGWPRPPLLVGAVLGLSVERYLRISIDRYGPSFMLRPVVMVVSLVIFVIVGSAVWAAFKRQVVLKSGNPAAQADVIRVTTSAVWFDVAVLASFSALYVAGRNLPDIARWFPSLVAMSGIVVMVVKLILDAMSLRRQGDIPTPTAPEQTTMPAELDTGGYDSGDVADENSGDIKIHIRTSSTLTSHSPAYWFGWLLVLMVSGWLIGIQVAGFIWIQLFFQSETKLRVRARVYYAVGYVALVGIITYLTRIEWPNGIYEFWS